MNIKIDESNIPTELDITPKLREAAMHDDFKTGKAYRNELEEHYKAITGREMKKNCNESCIALAFQILRNWFKGYESKKPHTPPRETKVIDGKFDTGSGKGKSSEPENDKKGKEEPPYLYPIHDGKKLDDMKLKDLREHYPDIKATKTKDFIAQVKEQIDANRPVTVIVIEAREEYILDGYRDVPKQPGIKTLFVLNPKLEEDEKMTTLQGQYNPQELKALEEDIEAQLLATSQLPNDPPTS